MTKNETYLAILTGILVGCFLGTILSTVKINNLIKMRVASEVSQYRWDSMERTLKNSNRGELIVNDNRLCVFEGSAIQRGNNASVEYELHPLTSTRDGRLADSGAITTFGMKATSCEDCHNQATFYNRDSLIKIMVN